MIQLKLIIVENGHEHPNPTFILECNSYPHAEQLVEALRTTAIETSKKLCSKGGKFEEKWSPITTTGKEGL